MCKCGIVVRLLFLLYANLLILVTLCEGNHYPFIEERYKFNLRNSLFLEEIFNHLSSLIFF